MKIGARNAEYFRLFLATLPAMLMLSLAVFLSAAERERQRTEFMAEQARLLASAVDSRMERLLIATMFCASDPAIVTRIDPVGAAANCGRYAEMLDAWVVVVVLGDIHKQVVNTRRDAPIALPSYPREEEHKALLDLENRSRETRKPGIAEVFTGKIYQGGIVSAGQLIRLGDGREAMIYVSVPAATFSGYLSQLSGAGQTIFALVDPSSRIVARSQDIEKYMFAAAPAWLTDGSVAEGEDARLSVAGPAEIGGTWDAGYRSLSAVTGWTAVAVQPAEVRFALWSFLSIETTLLLAGLGGSALLFWTNENRKRALRRVRSSEKSHFLAEQQSRDKSQLLATFAHDVRSPLVSLIGSLAIVEESEQTGHNHLRAARSSAEALLQLVDDTLELSYLGSGRFTPQLSPVDLRVLVADLLGQLQSEAQRKGLRLVLDLGQSVPQTVQLDRLRLEQVLRNLVSNGIKYTEEGSVSVRIRAIDIQDGILFLNFIVEDTGVGIAEEDAQKVFREFGRLDRINERREFGSGLGLAISKRILKAMGSELLVESNLGNGTSFSFVIRSPVTQAEQPVFEARPLSGMTILYAEDEAIIRHLTARQLRDAGATVIEAEDGEVALSELRKKAPDLLLIDIEMPRLDGVETLRRLRTSDPGHRYPIFCPDVPHIRAEVRHSTFFGC